MRNAGRLVMRRLLSALLLATMLLLSGCLDVSDGQDTQKFNGLDYNPPITAPDFTLTNQYNTTTTLSDHSGKVVVVAFTYTHCPDVCLDLEANLLTLMSELGSDYGTEVEIISITVDPVRDTPEHLANWTSVRGYTWPHVTSDNHTLLVELWNDWGVAVFNEHINSNHSEGDGHENDEHEDDAYEVGHSTTITFLVDRNGMKRVAWSGSSWSVDDLLADVHALIDERQ